MGGEPEGVHEVRDSTGFVVGSPDWLEAQRRVERRETSSGVERQGMWWVALGGIIIALSLFTTLSILTSDDSVRLELSPAGSFAVCVAPLLLGAASIIRGLRVRGGGGGTGGGTKEVLTTLPPSMRTSTDVGAPTSEANPPEQP